MNHPSSRCFAQAAQAVASVQLRRVLERMKELEAIAHRTQLNGVRSSGARTGCAVKGAYFAAATTRDTRSRGHPGETGHVVLVSIST